MMSLWIVVFTSNIIVILTVPTEVLRTCTLFTLATFGDHNSSSFDLGPFLLKLGDQQRPFVN